ncbi:hypothetical protein ACS127_02810 [Amphibacillus sp. Q70]|uniref:hypothetical protein n=1 Tax=Amphibacillus sp. Q70 TaxID=3453416 RepID=UPI003F85A2AD
MKKLLFVIACLFLIGCQANGTPVENEDINEAEEQDESSGEDSPSDEDTEEIVDDSNNDDAAEDEQQTPSEGEHNSSEQIGNEDGSYSSDDAIILVKEFIQGTGLDTELNYSFDGEDDQGNYRIQVFEVVDHGEGTSHTATYGWYLVNPETGEVTDMMTQ